MKIIYTSILLFIAFIPVYAQDQIKRIIYEDLFFLNDVYNGCIIQFEQKKIIIKDKDTIRDFKTIEEIREDFKDRVTLIKIDSMNNFYFVEVNFNLIANIDYFDLFSKNTFNYVLYKSQGKFFKINGFVVSDILILNRSEIPEMVRNEARILAPKKFSIYLKKRNVDKIRKYLSISVLEKINKSGFKFNYRPYVKDVVCGHVP